MAITLPCLLPASFTASAPQPVTPSGVPPDTDRYIYRPVTKYQNDTIISVMTQIWITQP